MPAPVIAPVVRKHIVRRAAPRVPSCPDVCKPTKTKPVVWDESSLTHLEAGEIYQ